MSKVSVAIFGLNGSLGKLVLEALQSPIFADKIAFPIKAISRLEQVSTDTVTYIKAELTDTEAIAAQLKGTDVFLELLSANPALLPLLEKIAAIVKPKLFIPSQFGVDIDQVNEYIPGFLSFKLNHAKNLRALGIKTVEVVTGFFAIPGTFLYEIVGFVGIDPTTKTYITRGDPHQKIAISKEEDIGKAVAALATYGDYSKLPDVVRIFSQYVTIQEVTDRYEESHNLKLTNAGAISKEESLKQFRESLAKGFDPSPAGVLYYLHSIASQGLNHGLLFDSDHREFINPGEKLWKWGKF